MGKRKGFTFIEVSLFLAITAALFIGIALGMQNSIFQQRYNDATQNFFEFVRSIYSKVSNPQSAGDGNSLKEAIYGKLFVFGEEFDIFGNRLDPSSDGRPIFVYDVVGSAVGTQNMLSGDLMTLLTSLHANAVRFIDPNTGDPVAPTDPEFNGSLAQLASPEKYEMRWQTELQNTDHTPFVGSILVVRHPRAGTINTLVLENIAINVNEEVNRANAEGVEVSGIDKLLTKYLDKDDESEEDKFKVEELNFCVSPYGLGESGTILPQNIRILKNARNASSVQMIDLDGDDNLCVK